MPTTPEIQQILIRHVAEMAVRPPIVFPNMADTPPPPRFVVQISASAQSTMGISRTTDATAEIVVLVQTEEGESAVPNDDLVNLLIDRFPLGANVEDVFIQEAPLPRPPLIGDGVYSVPVIIRGRSFF